MYEYELIKSNLAETKGLDRIASLFIYQIFSIDETFNLFMHIVFWSNHKISNAATVVCIFILDL